jgi:prevent-host-death family protein
MAVPLTDARSRLGELVNQARHGHEPVTISDNGKPVAAIISLDDLADLQDWAAVGKSVQDRIDGIPGVIVKTPEDLEAVLDAWEDREARRPKPRRAS